MHIISILVRWYYYKPRRQKFIGFQMEITGSYSEGNENDISGISDVLNIDHWSVYEMVELMEKITKPQKWHLSCKINDLGVLLVSEMLVSSLMNV